MDKKKLYDGWIEKNMQVEINKSFPDKIMNRIYQYEQKPKWFDVPRLIDIISANIVIKGGLITAGATLGIIRIIYVITMILSKGALNG